jgi:protein-S-isoprenylcysteine O-methyltransferase Ste14
VSDFRLNGGWWVVSQYILMIVTFSAPLVDSSANSSFWLRGVGVVLFVVGGFVGNEGTKSLGGNRTPYPVPISHVRLVQDGIYGYMRHPLYSCLIVLGLAWSAIWLSLATLITSILLALFLHLKAGLEERKLLLQFAEYREYQRRVPRFLPKLFRSGC